MLIDFYSTFSHFKPISIMSLPKQPRQQMINLMYLVLMALLAMNVSQNLLKSFGSIDQSLTESNKQQTIRIENALSEIEVAHKRDPSKNKLQVIYKKSKELASLSKVSKEHIKKVKSMLIDRAGGYDDGSIFGIPMLKESDNIDYGMEIMDTRGHGLKIKEAMNQLRDNWVNLISNVEGRTNVPNKEDILKELGLEIMAKRPNHIKEGDELIPWHINISKGVPVTAIIATLTQLEHEILNSENEMINYMKSKAGIEDEFRTDLSDILIIPDNTHPFLNENFDINIYYGRRQSSLPIEVIIGKISDDFKEKFAITDSNNNIIDYRSILIKEGEDKRKKWPLLKKDPRDADPEILKNESKNYANLLKTDKNGKAKMSLIAKSIGLHEFEGVIIQKKQNGDTEYKLFDKSHGAKYQVANKTEAAIAALKMNVLYVGVENPLHISVPGYKNDQITPIVNNGIITKSTFQGKSCYMAKIKKGGYVDIDLIVKEKDGSTKTIKGMRYRAKYLDDPKLTIGGVSNAKSMNKEEIIQIRKKLYALIPDSDFDCIFKIKSFELFLISKRGSNNSVKCRGAALNNGKAKRLIESAKPGDTLWFREIKVSGCDGRDRNISDYMIDIST